MAQQLPYSGVPTVSPDAGGTPYQGTSPTPDAFGASVGQATQALGRTVGQVAEEQFQEALRMQQQKNETDVLNASADASRKIGEIEAEFRQLHGNNAVDQLATYQQRIADIGAEIAPSLTSPDAQLMFTRRFQSYATQAENAFGSHAADEGDKAYIGSLQAIIEQAGSRLVRTAGLGNARPNYEELIDSVAALGMKMGWDKAQTDVYLQKQTSDVVASIVEGRLSRGQTGAAQSIFNEAVKANVPDTDVPFLDANAQARIGHAIQSQIKADTAQFRAENAQDAAELSQSDILSRETTGIPLDAAAQAKIRAGMTDRQWDKYQAETARADDIYKQTGNLRLLPTAEIATTLERMKPAGGDPEFANKSAAYTRAAQIAQNVITLRRTDPGAAVRESFPGVAQAWQAFDANQSPQNLQAAMKASQAAQTSLGVGRAGFFMPNSLAMAIGGDIKNSDPQQAQAKMAGWTEKFGPYWNQAFNQMKNFLSPADKIAAIMPDRAAAAQLINTARSDPVKMEKSLGLPASGPLSLQSMVTADQRIKDFLASSSRLPGGDKNATDMIEAAKVLAITLASQGQSAEDAAENAVTKVLGEKYTFGETNSVPFHVQRERGAQVPVIERGARSTQATMPTADLDLPPDRIRGQTVQDQRAEWERIVRNNAHWVTNHGVTGMILMNGMVPVTRGGRAVEYTWDELQAAGIASKESTGMGWRVPGAN